jgi:hypothetical protein
VVERTVNAPEKKNQSWFYRFHRTQHGVSATSPKVNVLIVVTPASLSERARHTLWLAEQQMLQKKKISLLGLPRNTEFPPVAGY